MQKIEVRHELVKDLIKHLFWGQTTDYNTTEFETDENIEIVERAINIAKCQLPIHCVNNEEAIYQRCVELFRMGAYQFYKDWC